MNETENKMTQLGGIKTEWDLSVFYHSDSDPKIEEDVKKAEKLCAAFAEKYRSKTEYITNAKALFSALQEYEKLIELIQSSAPLVYFHLSQSIHSQDPKIQAQINLLSERYAKLQNTIIFFELNLGKISTELQKSILADATFAHFYYFLKIIFDQSKHNLTEDEEKIMNVKSLPSHSLWLDGMEKLLNKQMVKDGKKEIPISEAMNLVSNLPTKERRKLHDSILESLKSVADFSESELNAVIIDKKINDELRKFEHPYSATIMHYQNDEKSIIAMTETVTQRFELSHRFYKLKAKILSLPKLRYADRAAAVGKTNKKIPFEETIETIQKVFGSLGAQYEEIFTRFLKNGQVDVYPRTGKTSGAFCLSVPEQPTFVLLNQVDNFNSLMTFAHEMGHGIHSELSKRQPILYQNYTTSIAEVASTLFENFVFDHIYQTLPKEEQIVALHDKLQDSIQTIFRQIACFNFEIELHQRIRKEGNLPKEEIAKLMNKHMQAYLGPLFTLSDNDGYFFVSWRHIRHFFYVYSYAYGSLVSRALFARYKKDNGYMKKIEQFLSAGGSKSPEDIFKGIGIDTSKPDFFIDGLKSIEQELTILENLLKEKK